MIIGIGGKMGSGKNLVCDIIQKICITNDGPLFEQKAFAGKLKTIASMLTGIPVEKFEDQEFKKALLGAEWGTVRTNPLNAIPVFGDVQFNELMSVREFLQKLGTDAMRDGLHKDAWVNALFADYKCEHEIIFDSQRTKNPLPVKEVDNDLLQYPNWIITDMRFPNEMEAVKEREGITIRVVRPHGYTDPNTGVYKEMPLSYHSSEISLDSAKFDYEIINDAGIPELIEKVKQILITEKII